jgi:glycosyltransferase involved in cell wall biosynthesis
MKIWIINPYGNLPDEGWREYRSTLIANEFNKHGHEVVWWVSGFEHRSKTFRAETWKEIRVNDLYHIILVPASAYSGHISFARIKHERNYARNFRERAKSSNEKPDLIILLEPSLFFSDIILDVIKSKKIPFIIDILDLWPELFNIILPNRLAFLGNFIFAPLYWRRSRLLRKADGIIAATRDYLETGISKNGECYNDVVYLGINRNTKVNDILDNEALNIIEKKRDETWVIYAGTLGNNYDIPAIMECAKKIQDLNLPIRIFLAGDGSLKPFIEKTIQDRHLTSLVFLGKLSANDLSVFYRKCDIGLSSYVENSSVSMPVKAFDYLAAGLPIINSLGRDLGSFVEKHRIGLQYKPEDPDNMLDSIRYLAENRPVLDEMKKNAINLADYFDCEKQYNKIVKIAEDILKKKTES